MALLFRVRIGVLELLVLSMPPVREEGARQQEQGQYPEDRRLSVRFREIGETYCTEEQCYPKKEPECSPGQDVEETAGPLVAGVAEETGSCETNSPDCCHPPAGVGVEEKCVDRKRRRYSDNRHSHGQNYCQQHQKDKQGGEKEDGTQQAGTDQLQISLPVECHAEHGDIACFHEFHDVILQWLILFAETRTPVPTMSQSGQVRLAHSM